MQTDRNLKQHLDVKNNPSGDTGNHRKKPIPTKIVKLPCGCEYKDSDFLLVRIHECDRHRLQRTRKKPYRPKAECVRP
jgi:hypothetical protein